jgi:hypothetical protein
MFNKPTSGPSKILKLTLPCNAVQPTKVLQIELSVISESYHCFNHKSKWGLNLVGFLELLHAAKFWLA